MDNMQWIFFDIGSTLVDETKACAHRLEDVIAGTGISYEQAYLRAVALAKQNCAQPIKALGLPITPWHSEDEAVLPQAARVLSELHKAYKIGIIANQPFGTADRLKAFGLSEYIDLLVSSAEEGVAKPDLRIFKIALERSGCLPQNAVMVGDRLDNDIVPAKALGMKTVWIRQGFGGMATPASEKEIPDYRIENLNGLLRIFG